MGRKPQEIAGIDRNLAAVIHRQLQELGETQTTLAKHAGVTVSRLSDCLTNKRPFLVNEIEAIAHALDMKPHQLILKAENAISKENQTPIPKRLRTQNPAPAAGSLGYRLLEWRSAKKLTQAAAAEIIGITPLTLSKIERGETKTPKPETLLLIQQVLEGRQLTPSERIDAAFAAVEQSRSQPATPKQLPDDYNTSHPDPEYGLAAREISEQDQQALNQYNQHAE